MLIIALFIASVRIDYVSLQKGSNDSRHTNSVSNVIAIICTLILLLFILVKLKVR